MYEILKKLIKCIPSNNKDIITYLSFKDYLKEYKTIELNLPRCSGKTTAIARLAAEMSALVIVANYNMIVIYKREYNIPTICDINSYINNTIGTQYANMKYSIILVDEAFNTDLTELVQHLQVRNMLEKDFIIIKVGTQ